MSNKPPITFAFDQEFKEQIEFFQQKVRLPTKKYSDLLGGGHSRAFVVAGATKDQLLCDFQTEVGKAIATGGGLKEFQNTFDDIVKKHGWIHKGKPAWRAKVIFETNLRTSYMAGQYKQMTDPDLLKMRPYWEYRHGGSKNPRIEHLRLHGMVLRADDPFWRTHYPPNGWGCSCDVMSRSDHDLKRLGKKLEKAPDIEYQDKVIGHGDEALTVSVPRGIDPGWDYNPGQAAFGDMKRIEPMEPGAQNWKPIDYKQDRAPQQESETASSALPPPDLPFVKRELPKQPTVETVDAAVKIIEQELGKEPVFTCKTKAFDYNVLLEPTYLAKHIIADKSDPDRIRYVPLVRECIEDPHEVWMRFEENTISGKVRLVFNFLKSFEIESDGNPDKKTLLVFANAVNGKIAVTTMFPTNDETYNGQKRSGKLVLSKI